MQHLILCSLFVMEYSQVYMDQLELVFWLLVHLQFMYLQYNVNLRIVVHTYILYIIIYTYVVKTILGHPWGAKICTVPVQRFGIALILVNFIGLNPIEYVQGHTGG